MLARLSFAFVHQFFFEGLLNFLLSLFSVRLSPNICGSLFCSLQKVSGASGAFFETHPEMFFGRFPQMPFTQSEINLNLSQYSYQLWSMYHCRTNILKENNTPVQLHSAKDQTWYSLDLFQESNFEFHLISSYFRPWTAKSKWMSNVRCLVTCDSWKGFGDKSGAEVNRCPRSPGETEGSPTLRAWSLEAVGSKLGLRGLSWEHSRSGLRQVHAAQAVAGSSCQDGKYIFIDLSHGSLPPWQLSSPPRWVGATILKMPRRTWMTCGTA